ALRLPPAPAAPPNPPPSRAPTTPPLPTPAIASPSRPCSIGTALAWMSTPACRCCRPTWDTSIPSRPTGICRPPPNCSPWPPAGSTITGETSHERARPHSPRVLHRPADPPASGQRPHHHRLPQHHPAAAAVRLAADRTPARPAHPRRPGRTDDRRVPATPGDRPGQQRDNPQRPAGRDPLAVSLRRPPGP